MRTLTILSAVAISARFVSAQYYAMTMDTLPKDNLITGQLGKVRLAKLDLGQNQDTSSIQFFAGDNFLTEYPSDTLARDTKTNRLYFVDRKSLSTTSQSNYTRSIKSIAADAKSTTAPTSILTLEPKLVATFDMPELTGPALGCLEIDTARRWLYFCHGDPGPSTTLVSRMALDNPTASKPQLLYNGTIDQYKSNSVSRLVIDGSKGVLYIATYGGLLTADVSGAEVKTAVFLTTFAPYSFRLDFATSNVIYIGGKTQVESLLVKRPFASLNATFDGHQSVDTVLMNLTAALTPFRGSAEGALVEKSRVLLLGGSLISIPYSQDKTDIEAAASILFNVTAAYPEVARVFPLVGESVTFEQSPFGVTIAVLTSLAIAAAMSAAMVSSGGSSAGAGASSSAAGGGSAGAGAGPLQQALQAVQNPTPLLLSLIGQLQFMVMLGQLGGEMPKIYQEFVASISFIWLGFKGASFGLKPSNAIADAKNGLAKFAEMMDMDIGHTFASIMIIFLIVSGIILLVSGTAHFVVSRKGDDPAAVASKAKISTTAATLMGHLFLFSYLSLCTTSVNQLTIADAAAGFFAGVVLILMCTSFLVLLYLAVKPPVNLKKDQGGDAGAAAVTKMSWLDAITSFSANVYAKFFQKPLCDDFLDSAHFAGFVLMTVKYLTGLFTGAVQKVPTAQTVLIALLILAEGAYILKARPYKMQALWYLHWISSFVRFLSIAIKLGVVAAHDENNVAAGVALLVFNGILVMTEIGGIFVGIGAMIKEKFGKKREKGGAVKPESDIEKTAPVEESAKQESTEN